MQDVCVRARICVSEAGKLSRIEKKKYKTQSAMIYKESGSYEAPNSVVLGMINEAVICTSPGAPGGDDVIIDDDDDY